MKLLLRRRQRPGLRTAIIFVLEARANLSPEERKAINKYNLGDTVLYSKYVVTDRGSGLLGLVGRIAHNATNMSLNVRDLTRGKTLECKTIVEMLAVEDEVKNAAKMFNKILLAAQLFDGEEVIDLAA